MASGVKPVPTLGVVTPPDAGGAISAPAVSAPPPAATGTGITPSGQEPSTPSQVPVAGTQGALLRPANDIDRQLYLAKAYADARQFDKSSAAYDKYGRLVVDRKLNAVDNATPAEMSNIISEASGENYRVSQNKDDPTLFSLSKLEADKDGKFTETPILKDVSRGELKGHYGQYISQDEDMRQSLIKNSREERMAAIEARSNLAKNEAIIKHYAAATGETIEDTQGKAQARQHTAKVYDDIDFGKQEGTAIRDPARMAALANDPSYNYKTKVQQPDGTTKEVIGNYMRDKMLREQTDWQTNKWSSPATQIVRRVKTADGDGFAVLDKTGQYATGPGGKPVIYDTPSEAYNRAIGIYGNDAEGALKTIKAAQAAGKAPATAAAAGAKPAAGGKAPPGVAPKPTAPPPVVVGATPAKLAALKAQHDKTYAAFQAAKDPAQRAQLSNQMMAEAQDIYTAQADVDRTTAAARNAQRGRNMQAIVAATPRRIGVTNSIGDTLGPD
jgi:hypothetical protein